MGRLAGLNVVAEDSITFQALGDFVAQQGVAEQIVVKPIAAKSGGAQSRISIRHTKDIVKARHAAYLLAEELGFSGSRITLVTTVISELARNIILYAGSGEVVLSALRNGTRKAVLVEALDNGPGIADLQCATTSGFSTSGGQGLGLSGLKRIADHFEIRSHPGEGTQVAVRIFSS